MSIHHKKLPIAALERIDDVCAEFEKKWQVNQPLSIESITAVETDPIEREALLAELIVLDVDYRRRRGDAPTEQEYADRFPDDISVIHDAFNVTVEKKGAFEPPTIARLTELFPGLEILELVGAGGMGAVYKARQKGLDRVVALKVLPEEFGHDVKFALRFTREARTLAKLNHPNIVALYEFGNAADTYYFLMEFVEGSTLRDVVAGRQIEPKHALAIVPHLCDALQYAHDKGVIHRDVKPENILMSVDGSVKIADFGLSRILGSDSQQEPLTGTHQIMGTPRYMAPEQLEGTHNVDHRADIYSLGVVIYEMLTGELPIGRFAAPSAKVQIDVRLDDVVLRTLEKEPQLRYQRVSQIKSDVQSITSTENPAFAQTVVGDAAPEGGMPPATLQQQELAARLLLSRRQLIDRVQESLRPLFRGHIIQIFIGIAIILLGVQCWVRHLGNSPVVVCGVILHVYGVLVIGFAAHVCNRISRIDYSKPVGEVRENLNRVQFAYLRSGVVIGLVWWLMWIPLCVAVGFHAVLYPASLIVSLAIGVIGLVASLWLYLRALNSGDKWKNRVSGESLATAYSTLDEIENANIR